MMVRTPGQISAHCLFSVTPSISKAVFVFIPVKQYLPDFLRVLAFLPLIAEVNLATFLHRYVTNFKQVRYLHIGVLNQ